MKSTSNEPPAKADIDSTLDAMATDASSVSDSPTDSALARRLDEVELLIEEVALSRELQKNVAEYVDDIRAELTDLRNFRLWATTFAILAAVGLFSMLVFLIIASPDWFLSLDGKFQFAAMASFGGGSVVLFSMILKGLYRSRNERHQDELVPEHIRTIVDAARNVSSN